MDMIKMIALTVSQRFLKKCLQILIGVLALSSLAFCVEEETLSEQQFPAIPDPAEDRSSRRPIEDPKYLGFWKKKFVLRPRWVKTWQEKKIYVAVWKHMWGPVEVKEWVPIPRPPPGWLKPEPGAYFVKSPH
ncbi:unnamed protein product, partial [Iphiclides podalirius]